MKWLRGGPYLPLASVSAAAATAPFLFPGSERASLAVGGAVALLTGVVLVLWLGRGRPWGARLALSGGLLLLASALVLGLSEGLEPWVAPALALGGAVLTAWGLARVLHLWQTLAEESESIRSRLARREGDVRAQADRIRRLDLYDQATGLLNRKGFTATLEQALSEAQEGAEPATLMLIELAESLPLVAVAQPDRWGRRLGHAIKQAIRGSDSVGRWDARRVAILMPQCRDARPAVSRLVTVLATQAGVSRRDLVMAGIAIPENGPWPEVEALLVAAQHALAAARSAPAGAEVPVWPIDWSAGAAPGHAPNGSHAPVTAGA
jgi:GGDEF domain-containing protein